MEPRERTHVVNRLMEEANLMMGVLEKAMEGARREESPPPCTGRIMPSDSPVSRMSTNLGGRSSGH